MLAEKKHSLLVNYLFVTTTKRKENNVPDYLIKIGNKKNKKTRQLKIFSSSVDDVEKEVKKSLKRGEQLISISNNSFPFGQYKAVNNPR